MSWNYRVAKEIAPDGDPFYFIVECYYEDSKPSSISSLVRPVADSLEELKQDLDLMGVALEKPVLNYEDF